jgi:hypothetical protein
MKYTGKQSENGYTGTRAAVETTREKEQHAGKDMCYLKRSRGLSDSK